MGKATRTFREVIGVGVVFVVVGGINNPRSSPVLVPLLHVIRVVVVHVLFEIIRVVVAVIVVTQGGFQRFIFRLCLRLAVARLFTLFAILRLFPLIRTILSLHNLHVLPPLLAQLRGPGRGQNGGFLFERRDFRRGQRRIVVVAAGGRGGGDELSGS